MHTSNLSRLTSLPLIAVLATGAHGCIVGVESEDQLDELAGRGGGGNGAPSGSHFQLNILGMERGKTADLSNNDGRRIFVPLFGKSRIGLSEGEFQVIDANGTDGSAAFQLPNPDPDGDGVTSYVVFARALGTPGGSSTTTTCATDPTTGDLVCSDDSLVLVRNRGGSKFRDVSSELLFITTDIDGDGDVESVPLFGEELEGFFWDYDNAGLRLAQLRFYPLP